MERERKKSRRQEWESMRGQLTGTLGKGKGLEGRENIPERACGKCTNFSENVWTSDGRGFCGVIKAGSNLALEPPLIITEGDAGMMVVFNMDAVKCPKYNQMEFIDTDGNECSDPKYRRSHRQMVDK
jgi:hypothetical protein